MAVRRRRRRGSRSDRLTYALGAMAGTTILAATGLELGRVWRRGSAPMPAETDDVIGAAEEAARETVAVAVEGYRTTPPRETALLNLFASFTVAFGVVRASTWSIRSYGQFGPFRNLVVGDRHIHHFVPGIALAFLSGAAGLVTRDERFDPWLAIPFGAGVALTIDEWALLMELEDVYWTEEGIVSVQVGLATIALLGSMVLARRALLRGEEQVLVEHSTSGPIPVPSAP